MLHGLAEVTLAGWLQGTHIKPRYRQASCTPAALCPGLPIDAVCQFTIPSFLCFAGCHPQVAERTALQLIHHRKSSGNISHQNHNHLWSSLSKLVRRKALVQPLKFIFVTILQAR